MLRYLRCKLLGCYWVAANKRFKVAGPEKNFLLINSPRSFDEAARLVGFSPGVDFNFMFTNSYRPTKRRIEDLFLRIPNVGILACSEYTFRERISRGWRQAFQQSMLPVGAVRRWTGDLIAVVREWLERGDCLGSICRQLNTFDIKISVKGLLRYHWKEIGPPPGSTW